MRVPRGIVNIHAVRYMLRGQSRGGTKREDVNAEEYASSVLLRDKGVGKAEAGSPRGFDFCQALLYRLFRLAVAGVRLLVLEEVVVSTARQSVSVSKGEWGERDARGRRRQ